MLCSPNNLALLKLVQAINVMTGKQPANDLLHVGRGNDGNVACSKLGWGKGARVGSGYAVHCILDCSFLGADSGPRGIDTVPFDWGGHGGLQE